MLSSKEQIRWTKSRNKKTNDFFYVFRMSASRADTHILTQIKNDLSNCRNNDTNKKKIIKG